MAERFSRPVAVVTGASRGIGAATVLEFARRGYDVVLVARSAAMMVEVAACTRATGVESLVIAGDLGDVGFGQKAVSQALERFGRIDALVNNAAWREIVSLRQITVESWEKTLRVCLTTPAFMSRAAAEAMQTRGKGAIVNISSIQSRLASGMAPAYIAAKGAIDALTYELAALYGPYGIRAVGINPGAIDTEMSNDYADQPGAAAQRKDRADQDRAMSELRRLSEDLIPLRRWGSPEEIARAIVWVAGDEASYLTGTTVTLDGGWSHHLHPYSLKARLFPGQFP